MPSMMGQAAMPAAASRARLAVAAIFIVALIPLLSTPLLPFIDLYNHVARYFVLSHIGVSALLQQNYQSNWSLLPNIGLDVIGTGLLHVVPTWIAPHLIVIALFASQYFGVLAFSRALTGRLSPLVAVLIVPLLYSWILNWGFANFLFGLGLAFGAAGWWIARRDRPLLAVPVAMLFAVVIFLTHGVAFALYGLLVGALEIGFFLEHRRITLLLRQLGLLAVQAVIPLWLFSLAKTTAAEGGFTNADESFVKLRAAGNLGSRLWDLLCYRLETIVRVAEGPTFVFDAVMMVLTLGTLAWLAWRSGLRLARVPLPALVLGVVLVACMPPALFGVGYIADRMPLFLALLFVGALVVGPALPRVAVAGLTLLSAVRLAAITLDWQSYARDAADFDAVAAMIPPGQLVNDVIVGGSHHDSDVPRCQMYRPLLIADHGQIGPLFANETQQPLRLVGPLHAAVEASPRGNSWSNDRPGFYDDFIAGSGKAGYRYVLVCNAARLTRPLPADIKVVTRTPRFLLLRTSAP